MLHPMIPIVFDPPMRFRLPLANLRPIIMMPKVSLRRRSPKQPRRPNNARRRQNLHALKNAKHDVLLFKLPKARSHKPQTLSCLFRKHRGKLLPNPQ
jgi:hypothetical protein